MDRWVDGWMGVGVLQGEFLVLGWGVSAYHGAFEI